MIANEEYSICWLMPRWQNICDWYVMQKKETFAWVHDFRGSVHVLLDLFCFGPKAVPYIMSEQIAKEKLTS